MTLNTGWSHEGERWHSTAPVPPKRSAMAATRPSISSARSRPQGVCRGSDANRSSISTTGTGRSPSSSGASVPSLSPMFAVPGSPACVSDPVAGDASGRSLIPTVRAKALGAATSGVCSRVVLAAGTVSSWLREACAQAARARAATVSPQFATAPTRETGGGLTGSRSQAPCSPGNCRRRSDPRAKRHPSGAFSNGC